MFFDNFLQKFELWEMKDQTSQTITNFLKAHSTESVKEEKIKGDKLDLIKKSIEDKGKIFNDDQSKATLRNLLHQYPEW